MTAVITGRIPSSGKQRVSRWIANLDKKTLQEVYSDYWNAIAPTTDEERFWFWIFAYLTVQQSWQATVKAFNHVKPLGMDFKPSQIRKALEKSRTGLYAKRPDGLTQFRDLYEISPGAFTQASGQSIKQLRDSAVHILKGTGIGRAKVSLAASMCYPDQTEILCLDRHIKRWYGIADEVGMTEALYDEMEDHGVDTCVKHGLPPGMMREAYWDSIQGYGNTRYWSHVLEPHNVSTLLGPPPQESDSRQQTRNRRKQIARRAVATINRQVGNEAEIREDRESLAFVLAKHQRLIGPYDSEVSVPAGQTA